MKPRELATLIVETLRSDLDFTTASCNPEMHLQAKQNAKAALIQQVTEIIVNNPLEKSDAEQD